MQNPSSIEKILESIDLSFNDKCITDCPELPFEILSPCSYLNIETMIISCYDKNKEYYVTLAIKLLEQNAF